MAAIDTIVQVAAREGGFAVFLSLLARTGVGARLDGEGKHSVFAPTDQAFAALPPAILDKLKAAAHVEFARAVASMHLVKGQVLTARLKGRRIRGASLEGSELVINGARAFTVNGATIVRPDLLAANGVIHGIDKVLWPKLAAIEAIAGD